MTPLLLPETRFLVPFDWFGHFTNQKQQYTSGDSFNQVAGDDSTLSGAGGAVALVFILIGLAFLQINCWCVY